MFDHLQIYDRRERRIVGLADVALQAVGPLMRINRPRGQWPPRRILLLRLERIGDLIMALEAIADVRHAAPSASIDLVVGSWNEQLARRIKGVDRVETLDPGWLAREGPAMPLTALIRRARAWRERRYDLAINFEPDVRSNFLLAESHAARTAGFASGGGGALLDVALPYDHRAHTTSNAQRLVAAVMDVPPRLTPARIELSEEDRRRGAERVRPVHGPVIGIHVSGGRPIKQWDPDRFAELAVRLARARHATIVLTGSPADREIVAPVAKTLGPENTIDLTGALDLTELAAVLERLDVFVTGDTGPMHLASAVGTPVVAVFGPSDPARYAPRDSIHTIVRIDLPCSPCNRIRLPPARCVGHIPDCLTGIDVDMVYRAVVATLDSTQKAAARSGSARG